MPVVTMLQRSLRTACATMHATRLRVLWAAADAVTRGGRLTLREPWLLTTSPALADCPAKQIVAFYRTRMQIEEAFRDMKSERYGFGLNGSHTTQRARWTILLLIAALAHLALWLVSLSTIQARHHYQYQANTTRHRLALSAITVGRHVIQRGRDRLPASVLWAALRHSQVTRCALTTP